MKLIAFPIAKTKVNKRILTIVIVVVLFLAAAGFYVWLQKTGKVPEFSPGSYLQKLTAGLAKIIEKERPIEEKLVSEELEITLPPKIKVYEQTAQPGEGITHLARRALREYLNRTGEGPDLTAEQKIYIEDYIQNQTGDRWLDLGETVAISEDLITEAINKSRQLTSDQLENLKQYSSLVPSL